MLTSSAVDRGFEPRSGQTNDYEIGIYCFSAKQPALRRMSKDWPAHNQNNVSELGNMSPRTVVSVSQRYKYPTQRIDLEQSGSHHHLIQH
jgi:hypothetical protein